MINFATSASMDELSELLLMFSVHEFQKLSFEDLINIFDCCCLANCILHLLGLDLDVLILVLHFLFDSFHVRFDSIEVVDSFSHGAPRNLLEDPDYIRILFLQVFYLLLKSLVLTSELHQVVRHLHCLEHFTKLVDVVIDDLIEPTSQPHEAFPDILFPGLHDCGVFQIAADGVSGLLFDRFEILHLLPIPRLLQVQQALHAYEPLLLFVMEVSSIAMFLAKYLEIRESPLGVGQRNMFRVTFLCFFWSIPSSARVEPHITSQILSRGDPAELADRAEQVLGEAEEGRGDDVVGHPQLNLIKDIIISLPSGALTNRMRIRIKI